MVLTIASDYIPSEKQIAAHSTPARWTLYGGAEGGGKTRWMVEEAKALMLDFPGIEGVIARYDYNDVMSPTQVWDAFHKVVPPELIAQEYKSPPAWVRLKNGSRVTFIGLKDYQPSAEFGFAAIDQAEEVPLEKNWEGKEEDVQGVIILLNGRLRQVLPGGIEPHYRMLLTCNPHPNLEWFLRRTKAYPQDYQFIQALPSDNSHLPSGFIDVRRRDYTDDQYDRLIKGSWDVFSGQAIGEFNRNVHVITPFDDWRRERWSVHRGVDYGINHPTVGGWVAVSPEGDLFAVQEYVRRNETVTQNARNIAHMSMDMRIVTTWFDPRLKQVKADLTKNTQWSVFDEYQKNGVHGQLSIATRQDRLSAWKQCLKLDEGRNHYLSHRPPAPRLYIFETCEQLIWELPRLKYSEAIAGADDIQKVDDDAYDAFSFALCHIMKRVNPEDTLGRVKKFIGLR